MTALASHHRRFGTMLEGLDWALPTLARLIFAGVLLVYFWNSGLTKLGDGLFGVFQPSVGAYAQIFPRAMEAAGYDTDALATWQGLVVALGTITEFVLPVLIVVGLLTRISALGMVGFVAVQSLTDVIGHGQTAVGQWFDRFADGSIMDQRALWIFLLLVLVIKGAGPLSIDRFLFPAAPRSD